MRVELPFLAEGVTGGDVVQVLVHEGDHIAEGQPLLELETDKATVPVPSPSNGRVTKLLVRQGDHLQVGQALVELTGTETEGTTSKKPAISQAPTAVQNVQSQDAQPEAAAPPVAPPAAPERTAPTHTTDNLVAASGASNGANIPAPPSVRRLARELGVDLRRVKGSETAGRITADDVKGYVREHTGTTADRAEESPLTTRYGTERREPLPSIRRKIAANMTQAWSTIPHIHQFQDADITDLLALQKRYAPKFKDKGATLTLTSLLMKAVTHALKRYPALNATIDLTSGEVIYKCYYNIGIAVDTAAGLIVPVIHHVDRKDLFEISKELADVAERTRNRHVKLDELRGATFSISNMGGIGAGPFTPIINPPEVGILGVGRGRVTPVYQDGVWVPRTMLPLCLAYDHRLIDGAEGTRFLNEIVNALADYHAMFLGL